MAEHQPLLGLRQLDHLQPNAARGGVRFVLLPGVALIDEAHLHGLSGDLLDIRRRRLDLGAVASIGRGHVQHQQLPQRIDGGVNLGALLLLVPVVARAVPLSGVLCRVALSIMTAVGWAARPTLQRRSARRSCTIASKQPAAIQRCVCW